VLVVEDDPIVRESVCDFLGARGYEADGADTAAAALEWCEHNPVEVVLLDYRLRDGNAIDLLPRLKATDPEVSVVILTAHGSIELAVQAIQAGADHFLTKPIELSSLAVLLERLFETRRLSQKQRAGQVLQARRPMDPFVGESAAIRALAAEAQRALASAMESPILITGETGSGKGVLAAWLHRNGPRANEPFVDINCAGLSRELLDSELFGHEKGSFTGALSSKQGLLEVAHQGTVFFDEIGDMEAPIQAKLLKVIEEKRFRRVGETRERQVDVRVIAATHDDLLERVRQGRFREDLYYRIGVLPLAVPSLRERREDIPLLARRIMASLAQELGRPEARLSEAAETALTEHSWRGNLRELRNTLERALLNSSSDVIDRQDLPLDLRKGGIVAEEVAHGTLEEVERRYILHVLEREGGNVERAAQRLGIPRSTLYQKLKVYGVGTRR
jgi:DNA-binding NtrC family response regulator